MTLALADKNNRFHSQLGFTMIELGIVLLIIGLLAGGVLVGRDMLRQAQLNSVMPDIDKYLAAIATFKEKYQVLPGDMPNATTYWGANAASAFGCTSMYTATTSETSTCNGDGNGKIDQTPLSHQPAESLLLWRHLRNAGMLEGKYTGQDSGGNPFNPGVNIPATRIEGGGLWLMDVLMTFCYTGGSMYMYSCKYQDSVVFSFGSASNGYVLGELISGKEALAMDTKYDDGSPSNGLILAPIRDNAMGWAPKCSTNADPALAAYDTAAGDGVLCALTIEKKL